MCIIKLIEVDNTILWEQQQEHKKAEIQKF